MGDIVKARPRLGHYTSDTLLLTCCTRHGLLHCWGTDPTAVVPWGDRPSATRRVSGAARAAAVVMTPPRANGRMLPPSTCIGVLSVMFACPCKEYNDHSWAYFMCMAVPTGSEFLLVHSTQRSDARTEILSG